MNAIASVVISALMRSTVVTRPLARPTSDPGADAERDRERRVRRQRVVRRDDSGERVRRADGEVDASRHEHERPRGGDDQHRRLLVEDVQQVRLRRERLAGRARGRRRARGTGRGSRRRRRRSMSARCRRRAPVERFSAAASGSASVLKRATSCCRVRERGREDRRLGRSPRPRAPRRAGPRA